VVDALAVSLIVAVLVLAGLGLLLSALDRRVGRLLLGAAAVGELGLLVQVVWAVVRLAGGGHPVGGMAVFIGYLIGSLVILPVAAAWGLGERSRWGPAVIAAGFLVIAVLIVRMQQVWHG
jgi:predicted ABC-type sugar transport system permease subunit